MIKNTSPHIMLNNAAETENSYCSFQKSGYVRNINIVKPIEVIKI